MTYQGTPAQCLRSVTRKGARANVELIVLLVVVHRACPDAGQR